ncbi:MAG: DUF362 domain-containing protein [Acidobacteria bacterium]|nr:DUF362 domain-containing protein [Acidobacteriota bacterium]
MSRVITRRQCFQTLGGGALLAQAAFSTSGPAPTAPVAIAGARSYDPKILTPMLGRMFDQIGGLGRLVNGKTVSIKVNLTGFAAMRVGNVGHGDAQWTHPNVIGSVVHLMGRAGARRIRILEGAFASDDPLEEVMLQANWEPLDIQNAASRVEFENTNIAGRLGKFHRFVTPKGGHVFPGFDLNEAYGDCDVFVSIAKMKEHATCGVTLSMKNCFGSTPISIYGDQAGVDEPATFAKGGRGPLHDGSRGPSKSAPQPKPTSSNAGGYRVPRIVADVVAARPIHLAIVEGILSMAGGEGPWIRGSRPASPGLLVVGTNPVCTDAVCTALMGFDPMAVRGTAPFETCDSTLRLGEELGVGTRDLKRIEVIGGSIRNLTFPFRTA